MSGSQGDGAQACPGVERAERIGEGELGFLLLRRCEQREQAGNGSGKLDGRGEAGLDGGGRLEVRERVGDVRTRHPEGKRLERGAVLGSDGDERVVRVGEIGDDLVVVLRIEEGNGYIAGDGQVGVGERGPELEDGLGWRRRHRARSFRGSLRAVYLTGCGLAARARRRRIERVRGRSRGRARTRQVEVRAWLGAIVSVFVPEPRMCERGGPRLCARPGRPPRRMLGHGTPLPPAL